MKAEFKPDLFSDSKPKWNTVTNEIADTIRNLIYFSKIEFDISNILVEYSGAFEINSKNILVSSEKKKFLIKRWSNKSELSDINKTLNMMNWLADRELPVPRPIRFANQTFLLAKDSCIYSFFPFIEGDYFSGKGTELENISENTGILSKILVNTPALFMPTVGPDHLSDKDNQIIHVMEQMRDLWCDIFGYEYAKLLDENWEILSEDWSRMRKSTIDSGPVMPVHFDLHPHNLLMNNGRVSAILDFESCRMLPIGYAFAFNALKQCRQAVVVNENNYSASNIGSKYIEIISRIFPLIKPFANNFCDLASIEIMRRLCVIFRLNIENNQKTWNHVLPIQLAHLQEAKSLFLKP